MKKQTIEIEVPDGKKAVWKDGRVVFEDIEPQLPNTWEEFCKNYPIKNGEYLIDNLNQIVAPGWRIRERYMADRTYCRVIRQQRHILHICNFIS